MRDVLTADGRDLAFVTASVVDRGGLTVPRSRHELSFSVEGPADLIAVDNGDPTSLESFQSSQRKAFNGLVLAVLRARREAGVITLRAAADGLLGATLQLKSER
ncbi:MAG: hypothetical protein QM756_21910 [Polyangiaceae bacterium]